MEINAITHHSYEEMRLANSLVMSGHLHVKRAVVVLESTGDRSPYRNSYKMSYMPLRTVAVAPVVTTHVPAELRVWFQQPSKCSSHLQPYVSPSHER